MSVLFQSVKGTGKLRSLRKTLTPSLAACKCLALRKYSEVPRKFKTFDEVVEQRRSEARKSLVVQVNSEASFNELYGYCSKYASIDGMHHYKNKGGEHFMLIEFSTEENLKDILKTCAAHQKDNDVMSLNSPFLWFRAVPGKKTPKITPCNATLLSKDGTAEVKEEDLLEELMKCDTISDQIQLFHDRTILNDLGVRLRYLVARQLESACESLYANATVRPFGSSVNGFGRAGCDLDLVLTNHLTEDMTAPSKRLIYQEKKSEGSVRPWRMHLELIGTLLELRVAGAGRVQRVLLARVPIVKYNHLIAGVDCDLCYRNMCGIYMSELLWLLGSLDRRVVPLTLTIRRWARAAGLTADHPGRWLTNFPLTLMVIFFLQHKGQDGAVLPPVKTLVQMADKEDTRIAEDNINCTFVRDLNKLPKDTYSQNINSLQTLLLQFFEFYSQFDFHDQAISINEGVAIRKPNSSPLYIVNPLEQALNVSRNVSFEECERLKLEVRNAAWQLESESGKSDDWGILSLIEKKNTRGLRKLLRVGNSHRLVSVKDLFKDDEETKKDRDSSESKRLSDKEVEDNVKEMKDTLTTGERREQKIQQLKFKNKQVANEVYRIRRDKMV